MPARPSISFRLATFILVMASGVSVIGRGPTGAIPVGWFSDLRWHCIGPFDGGPITSVQGVAGVPGVYTITTPSGGVWKTTDGGDHWTSQSEPRGLGAGDVAPSRQWTDPANPRRVVRIASAGLDVSLDTGATWTTFQRLPIAEVAHLPAHQHPVESPAAMRRIDGAAATVSIADPTRPGLIFAGTGSGVFVSFDNGTHWAPLQLNMPAVAINDLDIRGNDLIAATQGRSVWMLEDISPLRQLTAASGSTPAWLLKPADGMVRSRGGQPGPEDADVHLDYYLSVSGDVTLEVIDAAGRTVHRAQSTPVDPSDRWLPVARPLPASPGHHRVTWNLRVDPPPSPHHRFAQLARALFEDAPAEPDGPLVLAGVYRVRLTAAGHSYTQPLTVRNDPNASAADRQARRRQFELAMNAYGAMDVAHRGFLQLARLRPAVRALMTSPDADLAAVATDLDARLNVIDGSDWTGLVIPDEDLDNGEIEEEEEFVKHPDFVPPKAVSLSKDYDDPTTILGRKFANVVHAPALAILTASLGGLLTKTGRETTAPDAAAIDTYAHACAELTVVLEQWRAINTQELPQVNRELARQKLPLLPIAPSVPAIACAPVR